MRVLVSLFRWAKAGPSAPNLLVLITGLMLVFAYPPVDAGWLAFVALVPLLHSLSGTSTRQQAVRQGVVIGVVFSLGLFYFTWIISAAMWFERIGASLAIGAIFILQFALFCAGAWQLLRCNVLDRAKRSVSQTTSILKQYINQFTQVVLLAMLWTAVEWGVQRIFFGLSTHLGLTQWHSPFIVQKARYIGLIGISSLLVAVNGIAFIVSSRLHMLVHTNNRQANLHSQQRVHLNSIIGVLIISLVFVLGVRGGALRGNGIWATSSHVGTMPASPDTTAPTQSRVPVLVRKMLPVIPTDSTMATTDPTSYLELVLVQSNFTLPEYKEAEENTAALLQLYDRLLVQSLEGARSGWMNYDIHSSYHSNRENSMLSGQQLGSMQSPILVLWPETVLQAPLLNYPEYASSTLSMVRQANTWLLAGLPWIEGTVYYNSAILMDPQGIVAGHYSKTRPIPVAEGWASRGRGWLPLSVKGIAVGVGLCSELIDPLPAKELTRNGSQMLVFLSSLDHLGRSSAPALQGAFAPFRAAETGRYVAQVGSIGLTLIASPQGTIEAVLPVRKASTLVAQVPASDEKTLYMELGDLPSIVCLVFSVMVQFILITTDVRRKSTSASNKPV